MNGVEPLPSKYQFDALTSELQYQHRFTDVVISQQQINPILHDSHALPLSYPSKFNLIFAEGGGFEPPTYGFIRFTYSLKNLLQ